MESIKSSQKCGYHHGDLRHSLIHAAIELMRAKGPEQFSMSDCCKLAGVSKAAPYRHFANREALLEAVVGHGFEMMSEKMHEQAKTKIIGSDSRIIAIGLSYIDFAIAEPALFKLMFGNSLPLPFGAKDVDGYGTFQILLDEIIARTQLENKDDLMGIAFPLWTLVHGAAMLTIDNSYKRIYPNSDTSEMIRQTTQTLLSSFPEPDIK